MISMMPWDNNHVAKAATFSWGFCPVCYFCINNRDFGGILALRVHCALLLDYTGGGGRISRGGGGDILLWEISYFKCVRNFPLNFQVAVQNKPGAKFSH